MNRTRNIFMAVCAVLSTAPFAYSQPQQQASTRFNSAVFLRVPPDKAAAFTAWVKSGPYAKAARERLNGDAKLLSLNVVQALYGGVNAPQANYILVTTTDGPPAEVDTAKRDELYRKATGMVYADYLAKARELSTVTGSTLSHIHWMTPGYALSEGDYIVVERIKVPEGRTQDLDQLNREVRLPLQSERAKSGAIKGWSHGHLTFPAGSALPWTVTETTLYKTLAGVFPGPGGGGAGMGAFTKMFPNRNFVQYTDRLRESRTVVRRELYRTVAAYAR